MRLSRLLAAQRSTAQPATFALLALECLNLSRLPARVDAEGSLVPLEEQDRSKWDRALAAEGAAWLERAVAAGGEPTALHVEAAIAAEHSLSPSFAATDFRAICALYDVLYALRPSPVVALSRAIALGQLHGPERGLRELAEIRDPERLARYPFYFAALGELHRRAGRSAEAAHHFRRAVDLARSPAERQYLQLKLASCLQ